MQTHLVIENIFDKVELAKHIASLQALLALSEKKAVEVVNTVIVNAEKLAEQVKLPGVDSSAKQDLAMAHQLFGDGGAAEAPLPPSGADSIAVAAPSTTALAAPPVSSAPPPPAASPAPPATSAAATQAPVSDGEQDRNGYVWDASIHASTKTKNADGTWRYKRGVADTVVEGVEAAQRAARGIVGIGDGSTQITAVAPPPPVAAPPVPPAAPTAPGITFGELVKRTQEVMRVGKWMVLDMQNALKSIGLPDFPSLQSRPDLFEQFEGLISLAELTEK